MAIDSEKAKERLLARRAELEDLSGISSDARDPVTLDQQSVGRLSRMDALQQQAMAQATERQRAGELVRISHALQLLEDDEYGYCAECGEEIAEKRLAIDPAATLCVKCAKR